MLNKERKEAAILVASPIAVKLFLLLSSFNSQVFEL